jgi:hypothetical protein
VRGELAQRSIGELVTKRTSFEIEDVQAVLVDDRDVVLEERSIVNARAVLPAFAGLRVEDDRAARVSYDDEAPIRSDVLEIGRQRE